MLTVLLDQQDSSQQAWWMWAAPRQLEDIASMFGARDMLCIGRGPEIMTRMTAAKLVCTAASTGEAGGLSWRYR